MDDFSSKEDKESIKSTVNQGKKELKISNEFNDDTDLKQRTKESIEQNAQTTDQEISGLTNDDQNTEIENQIPTEEITEEEIEQAPSKLKKFLRKLFTKKDTKKKPSSFINNDLAPSLGNEGLSTTTQTKSTVKKRAAVMSSVNSFLSQRLSKNPTLKAQLKKEGNTLTDAGADMNKDGIVSNEEKGMSKHNKIKDEHKKQAADAINDLGEHAAKGKWIKNLSDSHVKGGGGRGM